MINDLKEDTELKSQLMQKQQKSKGFQFTFPNGAILGFWHPIRAGQKSYDLMLNNGKDNCFYKVGNITNIDMINEVLNDR